MLNELSKFVVHELNMEGGSESGFRGKPKDFKSSFLSKNMRAGMSGWLSL